MRLWVERKDREHLTLRLERKEAERVAMVHLVERMGLVLCSSPDLPAVDERAKEAVQQVALYRLLFEQSRAVSAVLQLEQLFS